MGKLKRIRAVVVALLLIFAVADARAAELDLVAPMRDFSLLEPAYPPPPGGKLPYAATGAHPNWSMVEWNVPGGKLPPFAKAPDGWLESRSPASAMRLKPKSAGADVVMSQDGSYLDCLTAKGEARELDMFMSPNGTTVQPPRLSGMMRSVQEGIPLSRMTHLYLTVRVAMQGGPASRPTIRGSISGAMSAFDHPGRSFV